MRQPDPTSCALFLLLAFTLAGIVQTAWFASRWSRRLAVPLDGGRCWRGRRLLGDNKTARGFVAMIPASAGAFVLLAALLPTTPAAAGLWDLPFAGYAVLGAWAGFGFMAGELPNSLIKRQLGVAPGSLARGAARSTAQFVADRTDSGVGMLLALGMAVPTAWETWVIVLSIGPLIHWTFSLAMFRLGLKARAA